MMMSKRAFISLPIEGRTQVEILSARARCCKSIRAGNHLRENKGENQ